MLCSCLPTLPFWVFPAARRRQLDALQRLDRCAVDPGLARRILAGSIGLYALAFRTVLGASLWVFLPRYSRAGGSLGRSGRTGVMEPHSRRGVRWKVIERRHLHGENV